MKMRSSAICRVERALLAGFALLAALAGPGAATENADDRPNILFLLTDDQRADTLNCMGHSVIQTPHLDALAASGVLFRRAFVTDPTCKPSRTTYFTGQYERVHRVGFSSRHTMTESQWSQTYPALLRKAGYFAGFIGKFGIETYAFRGEAEKKFDYWRAHDGWARFWPKPRKNCAAYRDAEADVITPIMAECVEDFLARRDPARPFCLSVSFSAPHGSISTSMDSLEGDMPRDEWMTRPANLLPELRDHPIYGALYRDGPIIEAVRTRDWKYVRHFKPGGPGLPKEPYSDLPDFCEFQPDYEQLFDLKQDPGETKNLAAEERHRNTLEALRRRSDELSRQAFTGRI